MEQNVCQFIPFQHDLASIHTINYVLETKAQPYDRMRIEAVYKMYYVCSGQGRLHTLGKILPLTKGDIFFTFPACAFAIETIENFTYMYISFVGSRGYQILEKLSISGSSNFLFHEAGEVQPFWEMGIQSNSKVIDLMSESVLLYTFSFLGNRLLADTKISSQHQRVQLIKKYIDDHFADSDFSIDNISRELFYNKKYVSSVFKKQFGIGIIEYLNTIRIQNACTMFEQGVTSISDISARCGFSDAQYFSKIFKARMGIAPTQYLNSLREERRTETKERSAASHG